MIPVVMRLGRNRRLHNLVAALPVYPVANFALRRFPLERRLRPSGLVYRVTSLDQLSVQSGLFDFNEYAPALDGSQIRTFIDLGCNAAWFALWLAARMPGNAPEGLLIDAHPLMASEASWHVTRNGLQGCVVVHGAVGLPPNQLSTIFHVHPSSSASSVVPYQAGRQLPAKGRITDLTVPTICVSDQWRRRFGDATVDLMKIDIEGLEFDFVRYEAAFLGERVRRIVLEWHKWCVALPQLDAELEAVGFERDGVYNEGDLVGLATYQNLNNVSVRA
jgi:FkbM family methyltransferase